MRDGYNFFVKNNREFHNGGVYHYNALQSFGRGRSAGFGGRNNNASSYSPYPSRISKNFSRRFNNTNENDTRDRSSPRGMRSSFNSFSAMPLRSISRRSSIGMRSNNSQQGSRLNSPLNRSFNSGMPGKNTRLPNNRLSVRRNISYDNGNNTNAMNGYSTSPRSKRSSSFGNSRNLIVSSMYGRTNRNNSNDYSSSRTRAYSHPSNRSFSSSNRSRRLGLK